MRNIKNKAKSIPKYIWILLAIILVGIFLRAYNFHDWLYFNSDQVRDTLLVEKTVKGESGWPLLGASMRKSGTSKEDLFYLGPIYYHFQIISGKIFGIGPDKMAYPDLLFSILSIPLFFFFLKRYFSVNISLALVGLYSISFFVIKYSRFAWNPNIIPFFVILFLLSFHEFLIKKEKTRWYWIALSGISLGVGIQSHMILLILFPITAFFIFIFLLQLNWRLWKKCLTIILLEIFLNTSQIISEFRTNFTNSKAFLSSITNNANQVDKKSNLLMKIINNADCHIEANAYILSSRGEDVCNFSYVKIFNSKNSKFLKQMKDPIFLTEIIFSLIFSVLGYILLIYNFKKEKEIEKKYFLGLIILYGGLSFLLMIPIISDDLDQFRYFINVFFISFLFLGLLGNILKNKFSKKGIISFALIFIFFAIANLASIKSSLQELLNKSGSGAHSVFLGEAELISRYIASNSNNQKEGYLIGSFMYVSNLYHPLAYLTEKQKFVLLKGEGMVEPIPTEKPLFYIIESDKDLKKEIRGHKVNNYEKFGKVVIYTLDNQFSK
jgi:hypothetical protein